MKRFSFLAMLLGLVPAKAKDTMDVSKVMTAIAAVENTPFYQIGRMGERSRYQITPSLWEAFSDLPFSSASSPDSASVKEVDRVVRAHIAWIRERLHLLHLPDTPTFIALVYKGGYGRCLEKRLRTTDYEYAKRVGNIVEELNK